MQDERNQNQIIRKDARECFVESLSDAFSIGKAHFAFATYDVSRPAGQRQTNNIQIYIGMDEILEICRKLECGELRYLLQSKKKANDKTPLFQWLGGTSAEKLQSYGRARADGKSLSRTAQLLPGAKADFLLVADSGPGETNAKGLIVPRFGNKPENHVAISMSFETFSELVLMTRTHFNAWLAAEYVKRISVTAANTDMKRYLWRRFLAIYPIFWLCFFPIFIYSDIICGNNEGVAPWKLLLSIIGMDGYFQSVTAIS